MLRNRRRQSVVVSGSRMRLLSLSGPTTLQITQVQFQPMVLFRAKPIGRLLNEFAIDRPSLAQFFAAPHTLTHGKNVILP